MKHSTPIILILISMFLIAQLLGLYTSYVYKPTTTLELNHTTGELENKTSYDLPYGLGPPEGIERTTSFVWNIFVALTFAVLLMLLLMKLKAETFLRWWFFIVVIIGLAMTFNAILLKLPLSQSSAIFAALLAVPLAYLKVFKRNIIAHNISEIMIYPGIAIIFIPLLSLAGVIILLIIISAYDIYAVWHAGFMQKMARYQIEKVRVFSGFFVPYIGKKARIQLRNARAKGGKKTKVPVNLAILGGGDVIFPIIFSGVVFHTIGFVPALLISIGATIALAVLFMFSKKGKYYPAMPFISIGCLLAFGASFLI